MFEQSTEYIAKKLVEKLYEDYENIKYAYYDDLIEITDVFGSVEPLLKYYVEPKCQNINPADYNEDEPDAVVKTPVFEFLNNYLNREFAVQGDGRNQLFILSDAGLGKTSLLLMLKLCNIFINSNSENYKNERPVELIKLDTTALGQVRNIQNQSETILLLDALDEDPMAWEKPEKRLINVLQASSKYRRVIISCRTQFFPEKGVSTYGTQEKISIRGYICPIIFLSLFDEIQVLEYLNKRFPLGTDSINSDKQKKSHAILKKAKSLSFRPFLLSHIEDLLNNKNEEWTELIIYNELVEVWLRREVRKKNQNIFSENELSLACIAIAAKMQESGKRTLTKTELKKIVDNVNEIDHINSIDYGSKSLLNRNSIGEYRFSHFSVQEYFLSKYILGLAASENNLVKKLPINKKKIRLTRKCLEFISMDIEKDWNSNNKFLLEGLNLDGFDFSKNNWKGCSFKNSRIRDADFRNSNFSEADFSNADLKGTMLDGSICKKTIFDFADLSFASLINVESSNATFSETKFNNSNLKGLTDLGKQMKNTKFINTIMPDGKRNF
jgi:uncharacterized protein YjbI with pentapeptide repeats